MSDKTLETIGTIHTEKMGRDAVHIAVVQCVAGEDLHPGDHVSIINGVAWRNGKLHGIVDPYIVNDSIRSGKMFWVHLYPGTITSLRHEWTHPDLDAVPNPSKDESEKWLREFCASADCPPYEDTVAAACGINTMKNEDDMGYGGYWRINNDGEYLYFGGRDAHGGIPPEFWDHVEVVTGKKIANRAKYFSCSC